LSRAIGTVVRPGDVVLTLHQYRDSWLAGVPRRVARVYCIEQTGIIELARAFGTCGTALPIACISSWPIRPPPTCPNS
jgi:hypothetical protein